MWLDNCRVMLHGIKNVDDHSIIILVVIAVCVLGLLGDHQHLDADLVELGKGLDLNVTNVHRIKQLIM